MGAVAESSLPVIDGFQLLKKLGQGGMGAVYMARQISMDRVVAVKILPPQLGKDQEFVSRFQREARMAGKLNHANVINAIHCGNENGCYYLAMEFVEGTNLCQVLEQKGPLPEKEALDYVRQAALGLRCAHENGLVHRDVKPDNLMLDKSGVVKVADLGLARSSKDDASLTQAGTALGTPHYVAPEQALGEKDLDARADIYSLGATLYHLLTGHTPFSGTGGPAIMAKHILEEAQPPHLRRYDLNISTAASDLVMRMMEKARDGRPRDMQEVIDRIDALGSGAAAAPRVNKRRTGPNALPGAARARRGTEGPLKVVGGPREGPLPARVKDPEAARGNPAVWIAVGGAAALLIAGGLLAFSLSETPKQKTAAVAEPPARTVSVAKEPPQEASADATASSAVKAARGEQLIRSAKDLAPDKTAPANRVHERNEPRVDPRQAARDLAQSFGVKPPDFREGALPVRDRKADVRATEQSIGVSDPAKSGSTGETAPPFKPLPSPDTDMAADAARAAYAKLCDEVAPVLKAREFAKARQAFEGAHAKREMKPVAGELAADLADLERIEKLLAQAELNIELRKGETAVYDGREAGVIEGFREGKIRLLVSGGGGKGELPWGLRDKFFAAEILITFDKRPEMPPEEAAQAKAAFCIALQMSQEAEAALKKAPQAAQERGAAKLAALKLGFEKTAKAAFEAEAFQKAQQIEALAKEGRMKEAGALLDASQKRFGATKAFAGRAEIIALVLSKTKGVTARTDVPMEHVTGGPFKFGPRHEPRTLPDFWIDKYEVSNKEYRKFVKWLTDTENRDAAKALLATVPTEKEWLREPHEYIPRYFPEYREVYQNRMRAWSNQYPEFEEKMKAKERELSGWGEISANLGADQQPVVDISWMAASLYAKWAGKRLPAAEEWDKAARGTDGRSMAAGEWQPGAERLYNGANKFEFRDPYASTGPVDSMPEGASPFKCHHMSGNVWEWIAESGQCRGGSYVNGKWPLSFDCLDNETRLEPWARSTYHGFRCAMNAK